MTSFKIDRRPFRMIGLSGNHAGDPDRGHPVPVDGDIAGWINTQLDIARGYRRIGFHMVQGFPVGQVFPCTTQEVLRSDVAEYFFGGGFTSRTSGWGAQFELYTGSVFPASLRSTDRTPNPFESILNPDARRHRSLMQRCFPRFLGLGFKRLWLDLTANDPTRAAELHRYLTTAQGWRAVGGEALPIGDVGAGNAPGGRRYEINESAIRLVPWMCTSEFMESYDPDLEWEVDPKNTEVHVVMLQGADQSRVAGYRNRGFIVSSFSGYFGATA